MSIGEDVSEFRKLIDNSRRLTDKIISTVTEIELSRERTLDALGGNKVSIISDREKELEAMEKELKDKTGKERATLEHRIGIKKSHLAILKENKNNL